VFELGQRLWAFASPLGRETWKKYYLETPDVGEMPSGYTSTEMAGIPLIRQMAEGNFKIGTTTVSAHYQSATALNVVTQDDPDSHRTPEGGQRERSLGTPSAWQWQTSEVSGEPMPATGEVVKPRRTAPRRSSARLVVAGAGVVLIAAALAGVQLMRSRDGGRAAVDNADLLPPRPAETPRAMPPPVPAPVPVPAAAPAAAAAVAPPPMPAPAAVPAARTEAAVGKKADAPKQADERQPARKPHRPVSKKKAGAAPPGWEVDVNGVPIPPM
jgi:hypothetical protein